MRIKPPSTTRTGEYLLEKPVGVKLAVLLTCASLWNHVVCCPIGSNACHGDILETRHEASAFLANGTDTPNDCASGLFPPRCSQTDSCRNRCGETADDVDYTCHCDQLCVKYGDCCVDVQEHCSIDVLDNPPAQRPPCIYDPDSYLDQSFLFVSTCPHGADINSDEDDDVKVLGEDGIVYANAARARCNGATSAMPLVLVDNSEAESGNHSTGPFVRTCVKAVDTCGTKGTLFGERSLNSLCASFQGPVRSFRRPGRKRRLYRNAYCALCNGDVPDLRCPGGLTTYSQKEMANSLFQDTREKSSEVADDIPAAFSIVLNFGLDGVEKYKFSSETKETMLHNEERCQENFIWDPFAELCRQIYCGTQFTLVDSKCIQKPKESTGRIVTNTSLFSVRSINYTRITVVMNLSLDHANEIRMENLKQSLSNSIVKYYNISAERIKNMEVSIVWDPEHVREYLETSNSVLLIHENGYGLEETDSLESANSSGTPATLITHFDLYESPKEDIEPSINAIIESIASSFSLSSMFFEELNATAEVSSVLSIPLVLDDWCGEQAGGVLREYWNDEFTFLPKSENSTAIGKVYVNKTGRTFRTGEFVANVLVRVTGDEKANMTTNSIVVVCDRGTGLPRSCPRVEFNLTQVDVFENNTLVLYVGQGSLSVFCRHYVLMPNGRVRLCLDELRQGLSHQGQLFDGPILALVSLVLSVISIVSLALVLVTYSLFSELRNLPGWNIIFLTGSLFIMQFTFLLSQRQSVQGMSCRAAAIVCHYTVINSFFWMNVLAYDLYKTFRTSRTAMGGVREVSRHLPSYMAYAFGAPLVIVGACVALDYFDTPLSPSYGLFGVCWIVNKLSALTFFAVPMAALLLLNFIFYVLTVCSVHSVTKQKPGVVLRRHSGSCPATASTYLRMATGMGLTWVFGFVAAFVRSSEAARTAFTYLFIVCNTLQGLFLFYAFVCNRKTFCLYRSLFCNVRQGARAKLSNSSSVSSVSTVTSQASLSSVHSTNSARVPSAGGGP